MIKVGMTELHGIAKEVIRFPPDNVEYTRVQTNEKYSKYIFRSAAKGVYSYVHSDYHDIIEAPLFPVITDQPWIYTPAHFSSAGAFDFLGIPTPRSIKMMFVKRLLLRKNFKKLLFKSEFGRRSLLEYGGINDEEIVSKMDVVYPIVRKIPDEKIIFQNERINLLFVGEFFRKGGANVLDAFLRLEKEFSHLSLTICSDNSLGIQDKALRDYYLRKIHSSPNILFGKKPREELFESIIPSADIYLCPTFQEAWGYSIEEAMAFGKAIIATNISAITEMIEDRRTGFLIDIKDHSWIRNLKGYQLSDVPEDFMEMMTAEVYQKTKEMIENFELRKRLGASALHTARTKFSPEVRKTKMKQIYQEALES